MPIDDDLSLRMLFEVLFDSSYDLIRYGLISLIETRVNQGSLWSTRVLHLKEVNVLNCVDISDGASKDHIDALCLTIVSNKALNA